MGALAGAASLVLFACAPAEPPEPRRIVLADAGAPRFVADLTTETVVARWDFLADDRFELAGSDAFRVTDGWVLAIARTQAEGADTTRLAWDPRGADGWEIGSVDAIELDLDAAPAVGAARLEWFRGGDPVAAGTVEAPLAGTARARLRFAVGDDAAWSNGEAIERLVLVVPPLPGGQRVLLRGARALASGGIDRQKLARALEPSWRLAVGDAQSGWRDVRPGFLGVPGHTRALDLVVPRGGARFRVALGATAPRPPTTFVIEIAERDGAPRELLRRRLDQPHRSWREESLDLTPWAGRSVSIRLSIAPGAPQVPGEGLAAWGAPEVVRADAGQTSGRPPHLVLISVDTLRADHLSLYGYERATSPSINAWARRRGVVFRHAVAPAPWTLPSHASLFTGLDAVAHGENWAEPVARSPALLAERLRAAGYRTYAETDGGYLDPAFGLDRGFDVFRYALRSAASVEALAQAVDRALAFLDEHADEPVFLFLHTYETHEPYTARHPFYETLTGRSPSGERFVTVWVDPSARDGFVHRRRFVDDRGTGPPRPVDDLQRVIDVYDSRIAAVDHHLGRLFESLERPRFAASTAVVLTSDHGEAFGELGYSGHSALLDAVLHVPLVMALPKIPGGGRFVEEQVRLIDVAPTLLELAGLDPPSDAEPGPGTGVSLVGFGSAPSPRPAGRPAWSYSPSTNAGLAVWLDPRRRHHVTTSPWGSAADSESSLFASSPTPDSLRRQVVRRLDQALDGMVFHWQGGDGLELVLRGAAIQRERIEALDVPTGALVWHGPVEGATLRLRAGESARWVIVPPIGDLQIVRPDGELVHDVPSVLFTRAGGFPELGVRWQPRGTLATPDAPSAVDAAPDAEVLRRLEALGYVG